MHNVTDYIQEEFKRKSRNLLIGNRVDPWLNKPPT